MKERRLTIRVGDSVNGNVALEYLEDGKWLWRCSCGNEFVARSVNVKSGRTRSCGHLISEIAKATVAQAYETAHENFRKADPTTPATKRNLSTGIRNVYLTPEKRYIVIISRESHIYKAYFSTLESAVENKRVIIDRYLNGEKHWYTRGAF